MVPPWLCTGMFNPLPAAFQALLLLTRKAPNTFPSHGGVVGRPSQEALIFQIGKKKKNGMWEGGASEGDAFSLFSFWGRTHPAALAKWKKAVRARLVCRARRQPPGWLQLGQTGGVSTGPEGVERSKAPTAQAGAPSMLQAWGTRHWGVAVWQHLTPAQRLRWARCQLGFQVGFLQLVGADPGMQILRRGEGPGAAEVAALVQVPVPLWRCRLQFGPATPSRLLVRENCSQWDLWRSSGMGITLLCGEGIPIPGGHVPLPQLFLLVALGRSGNEPGRSPGLPSHPGRELGGNQPGVTPCPSAPTG